MSQGARCTDFKRLHSADRSRCARERGIVADADLLGRRPDELNACTNRERIAGEAASPKITITELPDGASPCGKNISVYRNEDLVYEQPVSPDRGALAHRHGRCGEMRWTLMSRPTKRD
ncbi:hypothetical protein H8B02_12475 [Bradyrhizobium sp. Pear77]|uniref:hypothetical protein n=1 Tax=Bradyrhizobium altum TaxID=1571202 RepID=UPI001E407352|nr:hypothetical protein [Bradyrhizobium altum]MCC8954240.1 hypothetical protein [Bradyrhizobium altum]